MSAPPQATLYNVNWTSSEHVGNFNDTMDFSAQDTFATIQLADTTDNVAFSANRHVEVKRCDLIIPYNGPFAMNNPNFLLID